MRSNSQFIPKVLSRTTFDRRQLWNTAALRRQLPQILALFLTGAAIVTILVSQYAPSLFLILLRNHPRLWATIMLGYPLFSVYPQGLIYRAFFFHRYRPLLQNGFAGAALDPHTRSSIMIAVSAATFSLMHILFHNWIALALTFPGGILFALRYFQYALACGLLHRARPLRLLPLHHRAGPVLLRPRRLAPRKSPP